MKSIILNSLKQLANITSGPGRERKLIVLIYHRVMDKPDFMRPNEIDRDIFAWQMDLLANYFNILSIDEALYHLHSDSLPPRAVCLTFDDGYADNVHNALPILKQMKLKATFFIASGYLNGGRMWNDSIIEMVRGRPESYLDLTEINLKQYDLSTPAKKASAALNIIRHIKHMEIPHKNHCIDYIESLANKLPTDLMLTTQQVRTLHENGMVIGGHTVTHPILIKMTNSEIIQEIADNKTVLEKIINNTVNYFAYPNGKAGEDYLPEQSAIIQSLGFKAAFSTHLGCANKHSDMWQLPRFRPWDSTPEEFMMRLVYMYTQSI